MSEHVDECMVCGVRLGAFDSISLRRSASTGFVSCPGHWTMWADDQRGWVKRWEQRRSPPAPPEDKQEPRGTSGFEWL